MSFTYSLDNAIGQVRFLVPDREATAYDLEDAEITYMLSQRGQNVKAAAVDACNWLARKYAKLATFQADGLSIQHGQRAQNFAERAKELAASSQGSIGSVAINREDGYSQEATDSEYESRIVYIKV
jgi:hypothetical protein